MKIETLHDMRGGNKTLDHRFGGKNNAPAMREAFAAVLATGKKTREIAAALNVSQGTLSKALHGRAGTRLTNGKSTTERIYAGLQELATKQNSSPQTSLPDLISDRDLDTGEL